MPPTRSQRLTYVYFEIIKQSSIAFWHVVRRSSTDFWCWFGRTKSPSSRRTLTSEVSRKDPARYSHLTSTTSGCCHFRWSPIWRSSSSTTTTICRFLSDIRSRIPPDLMRIVQLSRNQLWFFRLKPRIARVFSQPGYPRNPPNTVFPNVLVGDARQVRVVA